MKNYDALGAEKQQGKMMKMLSIIARGAGGPEMLMPETVDIPRAGDGEILIEVAAAGVNRPDILQRQGKYAPPPGASSILGLEVAGRVAALGTGVEGWAVGDRVMALLAGGGYAEYCVAPEVQCLPVPDRLDLIEAAAIPENFFTVWDNVFTRGRLRSREALLVHGASSGIGTTAIQLAHQAGARVIATTRDAAKMKKCKTLGANHVINSTQEDFAARVLTLTNGKGADVILDMVGGDYITRNLACLAVEGRLVQIAFLRGSKAEIDLAPLMVKRQTITGSTLRPRSITEKGVIAQALHENIWPWLAEGRVRPVIDKVVALADAAEAHRLMEQNQHVGKIVLTTGRIF